MNEYTIEDYVSLIEMRRFDKVGREQIQEVAKKFRELEANQAEEPMTISYRGDITKFFRKTMNGRHYKSKEYKIYEIGYPGKETLLYRAEYDFDKERIENYASFTSFCVYSDSPQLFKEIEEKFGVKFMDKKVEPIVCKCGRKNSFKASYSMYSLDLTCTCGNSFTGYSG